MNIGVLDDNPGILDFLETALSLDGHRVFKYATGDALFEALSITDAADTQVDNIEESYPPFDLIILDLLLPGELSGADVFLALRKTFSADQLPIILITAVDKATLEQFRQILPDDVPVLRKPFSLRSLHKVIAQQVQQTERSRR